MDIAKTLEKEIHDFTAILIKNGLCDDQNLPSRQSSGGVINITLSGEVSYSAAMKNIQYVDAYNEIDSTQSYNIKMPDGGLLQLLYRITLDNRLVEHRLAFYSSPSHETYQNDPELYETDSLYADFIKKNIVPFPVRFDFNRDDDRHFDVDHPKSHLTLGQYDSCRIPVTSPMGPGNFIKFIMRCFYNTAYLGFAEIKDFACIGFSPTITDGERKIVNLNLGNTAYTFAKLE